MEQYSTPAMALLNPSHGTIHIPVIALLNPSQYSTPVMAPFTSHSWHYSTPAMAPFNPSHGTIQPGHGTIQPGRGTIQPQSWHYPSQGSNQPQSLQYSTQSGQHSAPVMALFNPVYTSKAHPSKLPYWSMARTMLAAQSKPEESQSMYCKHRQNIQNHKHS